MQWVEGALVVKTPTQAWALIDNMAQNSKQFGDWSGSFMRLQMPPNAQLAQLQAMIN